MTTHVDQERVLVALDDVWDRFDTLLADLHDAEWVRPTCLPGWRVRDVVVHVIGTESMLLGEPAPTVEVPPAEHVRNDIGRFNEQWVVALGDLAPAEVLALYRQRIAQRREALRATDAAAWDAESFTPAGVDTYGRFMRIRTFDTWVHEQDVREAVGRPGGEAGPAAELAFEEIVSAMGFVMGKQVGAPPGSRIAVELTGPAARTIRVEVPEGEGARAAVVEQLSGPPTVVLRMPASVFARLAGGRVEPAMVRQQIELAGDDELGARILAHLAYTI